MGMGACHRASTGTPITLARPYCASSSDLAAIHGVEVAFASKGPTCMFNHMRPSSVLVPRWNVVELDGPETQACKINRWWVCDFDWDWANQ
jgi:hypothetical protein